MVIYVDSGWFLEDLHGFLVIVDGSWWFLIIFCLFCWCLEHFGGPFFWLFVVLGYSRWFLVVFGDYCLFLLVFQQ